MEMKICNNNNNNKIIMKMKMKINLANREKKIIIIIKIKIIKNKINNNYKKFIIHFWNFYFLFQKKKN